MLTDEELMYYAKLFVTHDGAKTYKSNLCNKDMQMVRTNSLFRRRWAPIILSKKCATQITNRAFLNDCKKDLTSKKMKQIYSCDKKVIDTITKQIDQINAYYNELKDDEQFDKAVSDFLWTIDAGIDSYIRAKKVYFDYDRIDKEKLEKCYAELSKYSVKSENKEEELAK